MEYCDIVVDLIFANWSVCRSDSSWYILIVGSQIPSIFVSTYSRACNRTTYQSFSVVYKSSLSTWSSIREWKSSSRLYNQRPLPWRSRTNRKMTVVSRWTEDPMDMFALVVDPSIFHVLLYRILLKPLI